MRKMSRHLSIAILCCGGAKRPVEEVWRRRLGQQPPEYQIRDLRNLRAKRQASGEPDRALPDAGAANQRGGWSHLPVLGCRREHAHWRVRTLRQPALQEG